MTIPLPFSAQRTTIGIAPTQRYTSRLRVLRALLAGCLLIGLLGLLTACAGATQAQQQPDPRLKDFHILSSRIVITDTQAEVDGTVQNSGHISFPFDVTISATFYDSANKVIGNAQGIAEDIYPGTTGPFVLLGQVDSVRYSHMSLALVSLRERRVEPNLPTPTPAVP